jgi:hypothetical protein
MSSEAKHYKLRNQLGAELIRRGKIVLTLSYMTFQRKKNAHLWHHLGATFLRLKIS